MSESVVTLQGVGRTFGRKRALRNLNLTAVAGETIAVTGPNGSGKTTLLRIISSLLAPSEGTVHLWSHKLDQSSHHVRRRVGMLLMEGFLYGDLTVAENLFFYAGLLHLPNPDILIGEWLERLHMGPFADEPVRNLSKGERQKIAVIRSLFHDPDLLLWDEPTTALDESTRNLMGDLLKSGRPSRTVIFATHDPEAMLWANRKITLERGTLS